MSDFNTQHFDSAEEEAIDWYQHYMAIPAADLAVQVALRLHADQELSVPMEMAFDERREEIADKLVQGEL